MATQFSSAVYEGVVRHRRHVPHAHSFRYRMAQLYLDLDEIDRLFLGHRLWSVNRPNIAEFRRGDYMGPSGLSLGDAVRNCVETASGHRPAGPVRLLTHLRYAGYVFNPVSFYYCYGGNSTDLECVVAEITNTPWRERHAYVLPVDRAQASGNVLRWSFAKRFHVSPFMAMERDYCWKLTVPGEHLRVHMDVLRGDSHEFDATLLLRRRVLDASSLHRVLWRYPLMTAQVIGAIHWQAFKLWLKGNPLHAHPAGQEQAR